MVVTRTFSNSVTSHRPTRVTKNSEEKASTNTAGTRQSTAVDARFLAAANETSLLSSSKAARDATHKEAPTRCATCADVIKACTKLFLENSKW